VQITAIHYRAPELAEVMKSFVGFERMVLVEIQEGDWLVRMII